MAQLAEVLRAVLGDPALALSDAQRSAFPQVIRQHLALAEAVTVDDGDEDST